MEIRSDERVIYTPPDSLLVASVEESSGEYTSSPELHALKARVEENPKELPATCPQIKSERVLEASSGDLAAAQDVAHNGPDLCPFGTNFLIPPAPHVEYHPDNSGIPDVWDLAYVKQLTGETVRQFWIRFLTIKDKLPSCRDAEVIATFRYNCNDDGLLNALAR